MRIEKRICDLCRSETQGKFAKLHAPKKWAKGDYAEDDPKPSGDEPAARLFMSMFSVAEESKSAELDICRHCFKALFGAAAWLRDMVEAEQAR